MRKLISWVLVDSGFETRNICGSSKVYRLSGITDWAKGQQLKSSATRANCNNCYLLSL